MKVATIVEGDGEVAAVRVLLPRLAEWRSPQAEIEVLQPIRVRRDRFVNRPDEFQRHLLLAAAKCGAGGWVLVLVDADDDCPATMGADLLARARAIVPHRQVSVVLANREYEAWFIAAAASLAGRRGFTVESDASSANAETHRNAKGWIRARMTGGSYSEVRDQPAFSALMDLEQAFANSRSFRKLCAEWDRSNAAHN